MNCGVLVGLFAAAIGVFMLWFRTIMDETGLFTVHVSTEEVVEQEKALGTDLNGFNVVVTGGNTGIGLETAKGIARLGAHVVIACRTEAKGNEAVQVIEGLGGKASFLELDLSSLKSVRAFSKNYISKFKSLDILVLNAGVDIFRYETTAEGIEMNWGVNHVGHFELTRTILPAFKNSLHKARGQRRVVVLTSYSHWLVGKDMSTFNLTKLPLTAAEFPPIYHWRTLVQAYALSKTANVLFTKELARRVPDINTYVVHPGIISTTLGVPRQTDSFIHNLKAMVSYIGAKAFWSMVINKKTPSQGAATTVWCAVSSKLNNYSGKFYEDVHESVSAPVTHDKSVAAELWRHTEDLIASKL